MSNHIFRFNSKNFMDAFMPKLMDQLIVSGIINDIKNEKEKLILNRDLVRKKIEETKRIQKVNDVVFEWLNDAEKLIEEEENLKIKIESGTYRYNWIPWVYDNETNRRYGVYDEMLKKIKTLNAKCEFEPFSWPIPSLEHFSYGNIICFESTKEASNKLLEALYDDNSYIIGLYGKRGSGKTTLVKAMDEKAKYLKIFDVVLFVTVSQNPNIVWRIQDQIAESMNVKFDKDSTSNTGRAGKISSSLQSKDRILVILDDVREKLELKDIGIPCNANRCKVLLTTRRQKVCTSMDCQWEIPLGPLSEEEAWTLLKKHSGIDDEFSLDILNVAWEVALKCKGLPGTIKDVGSSLKGKPIVEEWKASLDSLRHSMARYHIFLSFRGKDTRYTFTGSLYHALHQGGFRTFMDEGGLQSGDQISTALIKAIEESRLSIIVLSENYADSSWCLDELAKILECKEKNTQLVWPIFYKVEPSDIRHQRNKYGGAMAKHEERYGKDPEKVKKWRSALFEVSNLSGKAFNIGYQHEFIQKIVEDANNIKNRLYIWNEDMD